jgi:hypothetical protein
VVTIAEQAERKGVRLGEFSVLSRGVVGNAEDFNPEFLKLVPAVPQPVGFERSTGGTGLRIEEKQVWTTLEIATRHRRAVVGLELEINKRLADGNHLSSSCVADRCAYQ